MCGIVGGNVPNMYNPTPIIYGPNSGGIGNYPMQNLPSWGVMEERPAMINPITGQKVYLDQIFNQDNHKICYSA